MEYVNISLKARKVASLPHLYGELTTSKNLCAPFCCSVVTEGPETCQHRDPARYRPHRQVTHPGVWVPGETFRSTAPTSCTAQTLFCSQMLKYIYLHNYLWPFPSLEAKTQKLLKCRLSLSLSVSPTNRTKISSSTWMIVGTSWACRMSRWVSAGVLLLQPTRLGSWSNATVNTWNAAIAPPGGPQKEPRNMSPLVLFSKNLFLWVSVVVNVWKWCSHDWCWFQCCIRLDTDGSSQIYYSLKN